MTPAEMECCKKMAGNCDMGGGEHKCCDTTVNQAAPTAAIVHNPASHVPPPIQAVVEDGFTVSQIHFVGEPIASLTAGSLSPPGLSSVLRI
jgi:hypothetical protein